MDEIKTLYRETVKVGVTEDFENAYNALTVNSTKNEKNEIFFTLPDAVSAEAERAFVEGFKVAVRLMIGAAT